MKKILRCDEKSCFEKNAFKLKHKSGMHIFMYFSYSETDQ